MKPPSYFLAGFATAMLVAFVIFALTSCDTTTIAQKPDGSLVFHDGSLAEKSKFREVAYTFPDGSKFTKTIVEHDQTEVPISWFRWKAAPKIVNTLTDGAENIIE